jgi:hypothetical protein
MPKKKSLQIIIDQQRDSLDGLITENERLRDTLSNEKGRLYRLLKEGADRHNAVVAENERLREGNERLTNEVILNMAAFETALAESRELRRRILHLHEKSEQEFEDKVNALVKEVQPVDEPEPKSGSGSFEPKSIYDLPGAPDFVLHFGSKEPAGTARESASHSFNPPVIGRWERDPSIRGWRMVHENGDEVCITDRELARLKSREADNAKPLTIFDVPDGVARVIKEIEDYNYRG